MTALFLTVNDLNENTVRTQGIVNQMTSCQHKLSQKLVQHIGEVRSC